MDTTTFYILRHGETEANRRAVIIAHLHSPLTAEGVRQAEDLGVRLQHVPFDMAFSSDSPRARRTAQLALRERKLAVVTTELLRERNWGRFDGKARAEFQEEAKELLAEFENLEAEQKHQFRFFNEIESHEEAASRMLRFLRETALTHTGKTILVASHGGIMRATLNHLLSPTYDDFPSGSVLNTGYMVLETDGNTFQLKEINGINRKELQYD
jgi:broad specificity phosphatase PhoE